MGEAVVLRVLDLETTGMDPLVDRIVETGVTDVLFDPETRSCTIGPTDSRLWNPGRAIPPEAMAVHHITDADVAGEPEFTADDAEALMFGAFAIVAHNAQFDQGFLPPAPRLVCTFKSALRIWPEAPAHGNQVLRYWQRLPVNDAMALPPHRAGPDTHVTAHLLARMLETEKVSDLVRWTREPRLYPTCPLSKFKGKPWSEVERGFLEWMLRDTNDLEPDIKAAAYTEIERRRAHA